MLFTDLLKETVASLTANKVRSSLTILGIVIGIGSVIGMISVGRGAQQDIENNFQAFGSNLLMVMPGAQRAVGTQVRSGFGSASTLVLADAEAIAGAVPNIKNVAPDVSTRKQVTVKGNNTNTSIYGVGPEYQAVQSLALTEGSFISSQQVKSRSKVAILGPETKTTLFPELPAAVGQKVRIDKIEFTVIGVTVAKGGSGFGSSDDLIYVPLSTAQQYLTGSDAVSTINVEVQSAELMSMVQQQINDLLMVRHNIKDVSAVDFTILNQADILSAVSSAAGIFTLLLGAIAGISLLVGGIGIMNMMLTTVTERTREIGLRKSLGAKNKDISRQFLTEAVMLTFLGGLFGLLLGWLIASLINKFGGMTTAVTLSSVVLAFGVSGAIGIIFGYYPAQRAARLNPIEALRYE